MGALALRRALRSWSARRWCGAACLAAAALAAARLAAPAPAALLTRISFAHAQPASVAHLLADFSTHPSLFSLPVSWSIEKEASNYTSWQYSVSYKCGSRCAGRALVAAHDEPRGGAAPRHGAAARAHRVLARNTFCVALPLLPWPQLCSEIETIAVVTADEVSGGAVLDERASLRCGLLAALALPAQCGRQRLLALRDAHLRRVRRALGQPPAPAH